MKAINNIEFLFADGAAADNVAILHRLAKIGADIMANALIPGVNAITVLDKAEQDIRSIIPTNITQNIYSLSQVIQKNLKQNKVANNNTENNDVIPTGFTELDRILCGGFRNGELIIISGYPAQGKTTLILNILRKIAVEFHLTAALFSLDMSAKQITIPMLAAQAHIDIAKLGAFLTGYDWSVLTENELKDVQFALDQFDDAPLFIDDTPGLSLSELRVKARRLKSVDDIRIIVVDFLQYITFPKSSNLVEKKIEMLYELRLLAKELNIPIVVVSGMRKERKQSQNADPTPVFDHSTEYAADTVLLVHRPDYYNHPMSPGKQEILIAKHRNGPTGGIEVQLIREQMRIDPLYDITPF